MNLAASITLPALVAVYTVLSLFRRWKPEIPLAAALALMVLTGIAFALGAQGVADHLGFTVLYLLVSGSVLLTARHWREHRKGK